MGKGYVTQYSHVHFQRQTVTYTDTAAKTIGRLPDRAITLLDELPFGAFVETAFGDTGTDLLDIGYGAHETRADATVTADPDNMATDLDVSSTGWKPVDEAAGADRLVNCNEAGFPVTATYAGSTGDASAGSAEVVVGFLPNKQSPLDS